MTGITVAVMVTVIVMNIVDIDIGDHNVNHYYGDLYSYIHGADTVTITVTVRVTI